MCTIKRTTNGTILTVVNWAKFQGAQPSDETTNETTGETTNETTDETLTRMNKNDKKEKKCVSAPTQTTPTLEEVKAYCRERNMIHVNPEKFWNYYDSKNWMEGGQLIKWKQRLAYWEAKDMAKAETSQKRPHISADDIKDIAAGVMKRREASK